jgi:hypothetical protein
MGSRWAWTARVVVAVVCGGASLARAQATRTWVSGVGDDANPCSRTAPCKTFAGAISKTAAGGEIDALDPGGFGGVTITKAITIDGSGTFASILVSGTNAVVVNAGATDRVVLRGLSINGIGTGLNGIRFLAGAGLHVEHCAIANFTGFGIDSVAAGSLFVDDTTIRNAGGGAISIVPPSGGAQAAVVGGRLEASGFGIHVKGEALATVRDSTATSSAGPGFWAEGASAEMNVAGSVAANNQIGVQASDSALVRVSDVTVTHNSVDGLLAETGGRIVPFRDNQIAGNPPVPAAAPSCEIDAGTTVVSCPDVAACPAPVCEAPIIASSIGPCRKCRTRGGVTTCTRCDMRVE